ncbi:unnamed protein product, partial [Symbiodinium sp. KB8]
MDLDVSVRDGASKLCACSMTSMASYIGMDTSSRLTPLSSTPRSGVVGNSGDGRKAAGAAMVPMRRGAGTGIHLHCKLACPPGRRRRCPAYTISASLLYLPLPNKCAGGGAELALHKRFALVNSSTAQSHCGPALRGNAAPAYAFVVSPLAATVRTYPESFAAAALGQNERTAGNYARNGRRDVIVVSALTGEGRRQPSATTRDSPALAVAERRKCAAYPELYRRRPQRLRVLACEFRERLELRAGQ